ncbi:uncharacterized protein BDW70DRAFT_145953 [Aspergillus foveolatus]|uniref:uncharacterized protein n=1 Tax=Aspergillus foveolatus TaxID=210207 RepID=UPI003CCD8A73
MPTTVEHPIALMMPATFRTTLRHSGNRPYWRPHRICYERPEIMRVLFEHNVQSPQPCTAENGLADELLVAAAKGIWRSSTHWSDPAWRVVSRLVPFTWRSQSMRRPS